MLMLLRRWGVPTRALTPARLARLFLAASTVRADIAHRIEIRFAQLRRQCPHVEGGFPRLALLPARPPLNLEIGVRPRSEPHLVLVAGGGTTQWLHREAIGARRQIAIGSDTRLAAPDGLAVRVYDRRSECFLRVIVAKQPHPRHPRSERRDLRPRSRHVPRRRAGGRREQADAEQGQPDAMVFHDPHDPLPQCPCKREIFLRRGVEWKW